MDYGVNCSITNLTFQILNYSRSSRLNQYSRKVLSIISTNSDIVVYVHSRMLFTSSSSSSRSLGYTDNPVC